MKVKKLFADAVVPTQATTESAGYDLCSIEDATIHPGGWMLVRTGIAVELPRGVTGLVCSRSGLALKHGVFVLNAPGIIDADYRGEVGVILMNASPNMPYCISKGDRIAQLVLTHALHEIVRVVDELSDTSRSAGGFGSTGS